MPRLNPTTATLKKLFAYCGNLCAFPKCNRRIYSAKGTLLGDVAHICAAESDGARYEKNMTDEQRRAYENLIIVCKSCHGEMDDKKRVGEFPRPLLEEYKKNHEKAFRSAEHQLVKQYIDTTQVMVPIYPENLEKLFEANDYGKAVQEDIAGMRKFIDKLKNLPLDSRRFGLALAKRMESLGAKELDAVDTAKSLTLSKPKLKENIELLKHHGLGDWNESTRGYGLTDIYLFERDSGGNPWLEILTLCAAIKLPPEKILVDLDFSYCDK